MSFDFLLLIFRGEPGNSCQYSSWPRGIETRPIATPSGAVWHLEGFPPTSPTLHLLPPLCPVYSDFEGGKKHFEVTLKQLCGLECIIILCLNYNSLWLARVASRARCSLGAHCHLLESPQHTRPAVMAPAVSPVGKQSLGHGLSSAPNIWVHRAIFTCLFQLECAKSCRK